jgi:hypothetical protein
MDQLAVADVAGPDPVLDGAEDEVGVAPVGGLPADDPVGERAADRRQPQHALAGDDSGRQKAWSGGITSCL